MKNKIFISIIFVVAIIAVGYFMILDISDINHYSPNMQDTHVDVFIDDPDRLKNNKPQDPPELQSLTINKKDADIYRDLQYAQITGVPKNFLSLDLYIPKNKTEELPLIIYVHGGAWIYGDKDSCPAVDVINAGLAIACINYRVSTVSQFPAQIYDVKSAVRWLRANAGKYNLDTNKFGAWGSSAGGHLVALLGTSGDVKSLEGQIGTTGYSSKVQAVVDWFGPTDFNKVIPLKEKYSEYYKAAGQLLGGKGAKLEDYKKAISKANPITYIDKNDPPFLIMHGEKDETVMYHQSQLLHSALKSHDVTSELILYKHAGHAFPNAQYTQKAIDFFKANLK